MSVKRYATSRLLTKLSWRRSGIIHICRRCLEVTRGWLVAAPSLAMAENFEEENHTKAGQVRVAWAVVVNVQLVPPAG